MQIREKILKSIDKDCLDQMLMGQGEYKCEISEFIATEAPTDWPNIMRTIYLLYNEMPDLQLDFKLENALIRMCNQGAFGVYCGTMVVFFQIMSERRCVAPFRLKKEIVIPKIGRKLYCFEKELKGCRLWTGKKYQDGLWGDIRRVNSILDEDYGIRII